MLGASDGRSPWIFSFIGGFLLALLILLSRRWNKGLKAVAVLVLSALAAFVAYVFAPDVIERGRELAAWNRSPWRELLLFITMVLGMAARYLWELIEVRRQRNAKRKRDEPKVGLEFDFWDFVQPLLVAVIVFSFVLRVVQEVNATFLLFSFQNGFFWQTLFRRASATTLAKPDH